MERNPGRETMRVLTWLLLMIVPAAAQPLEIRVDQLDRTFRYTGTLTLREPVSDRLLGIYRFVSGGYGRGSAPFGVYQIGELLDGEGPRARWGIHAPGEEDGSVYDPRVHDTRTDIQLHRVGTDAGTLGCIGIVATPAQWRLFVSRLRSILAWYDTLAFEVLPDSPIAVAVHDNAP